MEQFNGMIEMGSTVHVDCEEDTKNDAGRSSLYAAMTESIMLSNCNRELRSSDLCCAFRGKDSALVVRVEEEMRIDGFRMTATPLAIFLRTKFTDGITK